MTTPRRYANRAVRKLETYKGRVVYEYKVFGYFDSPPPPWLREAMRNQGLRVDQHGDPRTRVIARRAGAAVNNVKAAILRALAACPDRYNPLLEVSECEIETVGPEGGVCRRVINEADLTSYKLTRMNWPENILDLARSLEVTEA